MELTLENIDSFLEKNHISNEAWIKAELDIDILNNISRHFKDNIYHLNESAGFLAKVLQRCPQVHSVRWRVKDPEHLLGKIIRKRASGAEKYLDIDENNYFEIVTDLVGVRILHLFKYEWSDIHAYILKCWEPIETVKAYIREGDEGAVVESYIENGCDVQPHGAGYRSIHYIISTQPTLKKILSEIQVRTIFEEGWSEIDHKIRYPNFSDNKLISFFLTIFNRMAGSADEMGTFVKDLTASIESQDMRFAHAQQKHEEHLSKIELLALELSKEKKQNESKSDNLNKLNAEIKELRASATSSGTFLRPDNMGFTRFDMDNVFGSATAAAAAAASLATLNIASLIGDTSAISVLAGMDLDRLINGQVSLAAKVDKIDGPVPDSEITNDQSDDDG